MNTASHNIITSVISEEKLNNLHNAISEISQDILNEGYEVMDVADFISYKSREIATHQETVINYKMEREMKFDEIISEAHSLLSEIGMGNEFEKRIKEFKCSVIS